MIGDVDLAAGAKYPRLKDCSLVAVYHGVCCTRVDWRVQSEDLDRWRHAASGQDRRAGAIKANIIRSKVRRCPRPLRRKLAVQQRGRDCRVRLGKAHKSTRAPLITKRDLQPHSRTGLTINELFEQRTSPAHVVGGMCRASTHTQRVLTHRHEIVRNTSNASRDCSQRRKLVGAQRSVAKRVSERQFSIQVVFKSSNGPFVNNQRWRGADCQVTHQRHEAPGGRFVQGLLLHGDIKAVLPRRQCPG